MAERKIDDEKKEQESAEAISGLKRAPPKRHYPRVTHNLIVNHILCYLSKTLFKYVCQAFYFLTFPCVIRHKTDLG